MRPTAAKAGLAVVAAFLLLCSAGTLWAVAGGSISGIVRDASGAVVPGATLTLLNVELQTVYKTTTGPQGFYSFPTLPVGQYELTIGAKGFTTQKKTNLNVDTDSALRVNAALEIGNQSVTVTVDSNTVQVESVATHLGEVVSSAQITALPLNGRSYTDLLAIQPGVVPVTTLLPSSVIMAGVTGGLSPSGDLNPGNLSINGQRESSNGFMVNGIDVQEHMNGGTSIIPDLDSIDEFRVLTNNFDPDYGNYNGGMVTAITKSGSYQYHGKVFEFLRNTVLDARGYFDPSRPAFRQNQFGATIGGPVQNRKVFFFGDYQGTRTTEGIETGLISVPSISERSGNFLDASTGTSKLTGCVSGPYLAGLLSQELKTTVSSGDPYSPQAVGCTSGRPVVFPSGVIPKSVWFAPAQHLLQYIPAPNFGIDQFTSSAFAETVRDDKSSIRLDANRRLGQISAYYFYDDYRLDNPYPGQQGGASIPGFDALTYGRAQLVALGDIKVIGMNTVNEFHAGFLRYANVIGQPRGGLGVSLASQGFTTGPGTPGIVVQAPQFEGVENISFPTFVMGVPITNETQVNNTFYGSDGLSKVFGSHTIKFGGQFHLDQINEHPNATFNGTFNIDGTETGSAFADFLIGVTSNFTQSSGQPFYLRNRYGGLFVQDSWQARSNLTINFGVRWDYIMPFWEKYNQLQTVVKGQQSIVYPGAPPGLVFPGDPGIPSTLSPSKADNFAPRIGLAYAPKFNHGILGAIFGGNGKSSIRASYGIFYTAFPGLAAGIMYADPPYGFSYLSPSPPLLTKPFITAADGTDNGQRFPFPFPPHGVSAKHPDNSVNWPNFLPVAAAPYFYYRNNVPYIDSYMLSLQRQIASDTLLTMNYVGNQGHNILMLLPTNPGNQALCLGLSQPREVAPGSSTCGPFGEDSPYISKAGLKYQGTRVGLGPDYGSETAQKTIGNSNYNALEIMLRHTAHGSEFLLGYTYGKSIDQGSNLGEELNPLNTSLTRAISAFDMTQDFVASYTVALPFERLFLRVSRFATGWSISGTTRFSTGFPVTLLDDSDNSLLGTLGNGVNNLLLDTPQYTPGPLHMNTNGRNGRPEFNTTIFHEETLGQLGNARRRFFYGPGIDNTDLTLGKMLFLGGSKSIEFRLEAFNAFNHTQFYGPSAVDGQIEDPNFSKIVSASPPRLLQLAVKFGF